MERKEAKDIAIQILLENNSNADFYAEIFDSYMNKGFSGEVLENIPIPPILFDNVNANNNYIFIDEKVYNELMIIQNITKRTNNEIPYFILGFEQGDGKIIFKEIISDKQQGYQSTADYDRISQYVANFLAELNNSDIQQLGKPIICKGHTHGAITNVADNFSFGDLIGYITFKNQIREVVRHYNKNGVNPNTIDTVGMLINPVGDFNVIYYDDNPQQMGFYKFSNILLRKNNGQVEVLPTMSSQGNYIDKNSQGKTR